MDLRQAPPLTPEQEQERDAQEAANARELFGDRVLEEKEREEVHFIPDHNPAINEGFWD